MPIRETTTTDRDSNRNRNRNRNQQNHAIEIFDSLLSETQDYNQDTVYTLLVRLAEDAQHQEQPRSFNEYLLDTDVKDVLNHALNIQRMRQYTGKRGHRRITECARMLFRRHTPAAAAAARPLTVAHEPHGSTPFDDTNDPHGYIRARRRRNSSASL